MLGMAGYYLFSQQRHDRDGYPGSPPQFGRRKAPLLAMSDLTDDELKALKQFAQFYKMVQGWCRINKWIALTGLAILIALSQGADAIRSLFFK